MDFVGHFENIADDYGYVSDVIGISNKHPPKLVLDDGPSSTEAYDAEKAIGARRYRWEISYFGYESGE